MSNLGASLKKARETAGLPLEKIATDTRISIRFLLAIESEDFHVLPGGIFTRGFIRTYAERVGLDPEVAVADYDRMSATPEEPLDVFRNAEGESSPRNDRNLYLIAAGVLVVLVAGYYLANR
jgi:cytoskeleton protein RodZ